VDGRARGRLFTPSCELEVAAGSESSESERDPSSEPSSKSVVASVSGVSLGSVFILLSAASSEASSVASFAVR
jgi:hypothetical protein